MAAVEMEAVRAAFAESLMVTTFDKCGLGIREASHFEQL